MSANTWIQLGLYVFLLLLFAKPLGWHIANVYEGRSCGLDRALGWLERFLYRLCGVRPDTETSWKTYAAGVLVFSLAGFVVVYALQRLQGLLPANPQDMAAVPPDLAFNTAVSFVTNTNWQAYGGETTMSYLTQMLGLAVQNFVSAATGMAVLAAVIRGFARRSSDTIGCFWVDLIRGTLYILLPLSTLLALALVSQGAVQTFEPYQKVALLEPFKGADGQLVTEQTLAVGPAASQIAIKQLGTNGGGFFNVNSAHPFENPTPLSNLLQMLAINLIGASLCLTFGYMVKDLRQGWALLAAMMAIFIPLLVFCAWQEQRGNPAFATLNIDQQATSFQAGGNMEGKETRFGIANSATWAVSTTAASNGSVNSMHDSYTPLGGMAPLLLMQLGEVIFGGVGSGIYGMLAFAIITVFVAGLMVGRTPEYLGKKIEAHQMKMASIMILVPPILVLGGTALAVVGPGLTFTNAEGQGVSVLNNPGAHGFSEVLYAYSSAGNNNGSAFAGLNANVPYHNLFLGLAMLFARFWLIIPALAIAGSLAQKKIAPAGAGTLPTHTPLFVMMLVGIVLLVGALTFLPALALGPIVEHLQMISAG